ncbi:MAG: hypothetical protein HOP29_04885 [Phycisphaerales bacterium]|nr:hypothetical protein [Phycisphaerales bacterium]
MLDGDDECSFGGCGEVTGVVDSQRMKHDITDHLPSEEGDAGDSPAGRVLALVADLMFDSKIRSAAKNRGVAAVTVRAPTGLTSFLEKNPVDLVIVDLDAHSEAVQAVSAIRLRWPSIPVLAFGSHVNEPLLQGARDAGAARVWPRSRLSASLDAVMGEVVGEGRRDGGT